MKNQRDPTADEHVIYRLLVLYDEDRKRGRERPEEEYAREFPGHEDLVSRELALLRAEVTDQGTEPKGCPERVTERRLGPYEIRGELGRGGQGIVYEAFEQGLGRRVALKVLSPWARMSKSFLARFDREARAAANLRHPHIIPIHAVAQDGDTPYLAMQLIEGVTLDRIVARARTFLMAGNRQGDDPITDRVRHLTGDLNIGRQELTAGRSREPSPYRATPLIHRYQESVVRLLLPVVDALVHAHGRGVLHRDVKPSNIFVDDRGHVWLGDFGLAKMEDSADLTRSGEVMGTLRYMAPECLEGDHDARSDVYALGATFYELLTLRPTFDETRPALLARKVAEEDPERPSRVVPGIDADLEAIVLRSIHKDPRLRYQTANALAEDLGAFLERRPISARAPTATYLLRMAARRHRRILSVILVAATLLLTISTYYTVDLYQARRRAELSAESEARQKRIAQERSYVAAIRGATASLAIHDVASARMQLEATPEFLRGFEYGYLTRALDRSLRVFSSERSGRARVGDLFVQTVAYSPDGSMIALGADHHAVVRNSETGEILTVFRGNGGAIHDLAWTEESSWIISTGQEAGTICVWTTEGEEVARFQVAFEAHGITVSSRGLVSVACSSGEIAVMPLQGGEVHTVPGHEGGTHDVCFSPDGTRLASCGMDGLARLWAVDRQGAKITLEGVRDLGGHTARVNSIEYSKNGDLLATGSSDQTIRVWDPETGETLLILPTGTAVQDVALDPGSTWIVAALDNGTLRRWSLPEGRELDRYTGHGAQVLSVDVHPGGRRLLSGSRDFTAREWSVQVGDRPCWSRSHLGEADCCAVRRDGKRVATGGRDATVRLWDPDTGEEVAALIGHEAYVRSVEFGPGSLLVSGAEDRLVRLWDSESCESLGVLRGHEDFVFSVCVSPDGSRIASGDRKGEIVLWDLAEHEVVKKWRGHRGLVESLDFSPDGRRFTSASRDCIVKIWDATNGTELAAFKCHRDHVKSVRFSPDGSVILTGSHDGTAAVWDLEGHCLVRLEGHTRGVTDAVFSPLGDRIATTSRDGTVRIWEARNGVELLSLPLAGEWSQSVAFSPDGKLLTATDTLGTVWFFNTRDTAEPTTHMEEARRIRDRVESIAEDLLEETGEAKTATRLLEARAHLSEREREVARRRIRSLGGRADWMLRRDLETVLRPGLDGGEYWRVVSHSYAITMERSRPLVSPYDPRLVKTRLVWGAAYARLGDWGRAVESLREARRTCTSDEEELVPLVLAFLALAEAHVGESSRPARAALAELEKAIAGREPTEAEERLIREARHAVSSHE